MKYVMNIIWASLFLCIILMGCIGKDPNAERARVRITKRNVKAIHEAVNQFKIDTDRYPTEDEGLNVLIGRPIDVEIQDSSNSLWKAYMLKDGWGKECIYELNPKSGKPFVIKSLGSDGKKGGKSYNADILSIDLIEEAIM